MTDASLSTRGLDAAREAYRQARQELEYFGASEDFTRSPIEAAISAYLDALPRCDRCERLLDEAGICWFHSP